MFQFGSEVPPDLDGVHILPVPGFGHQLEVQGPQRQLLKSNDVGGIMLD